MTSNKSVAPAESGAIAIVGLAGRFPGAANPRELFSNLLNGVDSIRHFSDEELRDGSDEATRKSPQYVKARPVLEDVERFDAAFFGMQPREAELTDPQQRVFLECSWEALEDAGYDPARYAGAIGVFGGCSMNTYFLHHVLRDRALLEEFTASFQVGCYPMLVGAGLDFLATRVAYKLDLRGPAITLQSACSTSLLAVAQACQSLQAGQCDMALAGGVSISFPQQRGYLHQAGGMVSADGTCRPFDALASGTIFGSGAGVLLLKKLDRALDERDHIYAVIRGCGVNNDGATKVGFTAPSIEGQARAIRMALESAGVSARSIGYVECHGTATPLGDPIEIAALTQAYGRDSDERQFCAVGSVKGNVGHLDAAAGATGLIKLALALDRGRLPGMAHYEKPNPQIDFDNSPFFVRATASEWPRSAGAPRRAGISSLGVGGTNVHVIVEEAPPAGAAQPSAASQLLLLSARGAQALDENARRLAAHLRAEPELALADVAYTLQHGRRAFAQRRTLVCRDRDDAIAQLEATATGPLSCRAEAARTPGVAFMFPGQGAQYAGMTRGLYADSADFRAEFDRCADILKPLTDFDLHELLHAADDQAAQQRLQQTSAAQPALFAVEYALARLWQARGLQPAAMIGHSVGEFVAAVLAGVMSLEDALRVVARRGRLMQALPAGAMLAVRLPAVDLQPLLGAACAIAAINAPGLCVAAGPFDEIEALEKLLQQRGSVSRRLHTSHAFHSPMVDPVIEPLRELLQTITLSAPTLPYISCVSGDWITTEQATSPDYWARHAREPVRFADGIATMAGSLRTLLEVGPGDSLSRLALQAAPGLGLRAIRSLPDAGRSIADSDSLLAAAGSLWAGGVDLDWSLWPQDDGARAPRRVPLPTYAFERSRHWIDAPAHAGRDAAPAPAITEQAPAATAPVEAAVVNDAPQSPTETALAKIFADLSGQPLPRSEAPQSFLEMGFDSLFLAQVTQRIQNTMQVEVSFRQLLGDFATLPALAAHMDSLRPAAPGTEPAKSANTAAPPAAVPLTESQMEIWLAAQAGDAASCAFNQSITLRLVGQLDEAALRQALDQVVARHEGLRARFTPTGEEMRVVDAESIQWHRHDLESDGPAKAEAALQAAVAEDAAQPFDLVNGPLLRVRLLRLAAEQHALMFSTHHIVCDGWSLNVVAGELAQLYAAARDKNSEPLPDAASFRAYAAAEQARDPAERDATESHWLRQFDTLPPPLTLPTDRPRPARRSFRGASHRSHIEVGLYRAIKRSGAQQGGTLFVTLLSMFQALVGRLAGVDDVVVGVPTAGQRLQSGAPLVGHCVHFLPLRAQWNAETTLADQLQAQVRAFAAAAEHPRYTLATLLRRLGLRRGQGALPLSEVQFNLETRFDPATGAGLTWQAEANQKTFVNADLCLNVLESADGLRLDCDYNSDLFDESSIALWMSCYRRLLIALISEPRQALTRAPLLPDPLREQLLRANDATAAQYPRGRGVHELFDECAMVNRERIALRCGGRAQSYRELREHSNRLAQMIVQRGVAPGRRVGVLLERSLELPAALLAVLKAGCAYVPLDPGHPPARMARILADAGIALLVTDREPAEGLVPAGVPLLRVDQEAEAIASMPAARPAIASDAEAAAYVIYTSGSTGQPKGVRIGHRAMVNFLTSMAREPGVTGRGVLLAVTTVAFDIAVLELFLPLLNGATVVIAQREETGDGNRLRQYLESDGITLMQATPATWSLLLEAGYTPRQGLTMLCGGEALPPSLAQRLLAGGAELWNMYGPTETTVWSSCLRVAPDASTITVGKPIANTSFFVLDRHGELLPPGVPGELCIGGDGVAQGYHERAELTAEKFIANPHGDGLLYRTGDLARALPNGEFQVLGRLDHQVKLRGHRIELGEIEAALLRQPAISEAAVILREDRPGAPRLAAYYVTRGPCSSAALRSALQAELPDYMVPAAWTALDALPRLPNGKLDRSALPAPESEPSRIEYMPPKTPLEQRLARIWSEVLLIDQVSTGLDLFEFGADSIQLFQITARAHRDGLPLNARQLMEHRTIRALASALESVPPPQGQMPNAAPPRGASLKQFLAQRRGAGGGSA